MNEYLIDNDDGMHELDFNTERGFGASCYEGEDEIEAFNADVAEAEDEWPLFV